MRSLYLTLIAGLALSVAASAGPSAPIPLWPNGAPGEQPGPGNEHDMTTAKDNLVGGKRVARIGGITNPTIQVFPPAGHNTGAAVIVFPGGGYRILAYDLEGTEVCEWLNRIGITGVLLKYRVPPHEGAVRYAAPLQDAQQAMRMVRSKAKEWGIDPTKVGVLGFSAGGHLAAAISTNNDAETRPDFAVIIYPGYLAVKEDNDRLPPEIKVTANTPPTFLVQAEDDPVRVENSVTYFMALKNAKVPAEMHLYAKGGHGYGLRPTDLPVTHWPSLAEQWFKTIGIVPSH